MENTVLSRLKWSSPEERGYVTITGRIQIDMRTESLANSDRFMPIS